MSAFGVVVLALGVLMLWSGIKHQKINEVLLGFVAAPVKTQAARTGSTGPKLA
jgi:hypothetical protein